MNRLIIESVEGRITLGIVTYVAIMILIGWVAINEPARMTSFTEQQNGRAIERGAELFAANCSSCHGKDGEGSGLAPALNSPHFFGHDFMDAVTTDILRYQREDVELQSLSVELAARKRELEAEILALDETARAGEEGRLILVQIGNIDAQLLDDAAAVEARLAGIASGTLGLEESNPALSEDELTARQAALTENIPNRLRVITLELNGDGTPENIGLLAERQAILDRPEVAGARLNGYLPRLDELNTQLADGDISPLEFTNFLQADASRLDQAGFLGSLEGYILTTLIHGRPGSNLVWGTGGMVSWSQRGGGPLRDDQIRDIIAYIMNWDKGDNWTFTDLANVNQFARLHTAYTGGTTGTDFEEGQPVPATECSANPECVAGLGDTREIAAMLPAGDAANGATLYAQNACGACHIGGAQAPDIIGTVARVEADRLTLPEFEGWTVDEYLVTSILYPNHFVVDTYTPGVMPQTFGQSLTLQQVADLIAYIKQQ